MPLDWAESANFCIDEEECGMRETAPQNLKKKLCFSTLRNNTVIYIRADWAFGHVPGTARTIDKLRHQKYEHVVYADLMK
jgi:hypothetical protein